MNLFLDQVRKGRISSEEGLKRLFWKLAVRLHPDSGGDTASAESFVRLKAQYEQSLQMFNQFRSAEPGLVAVPEGGASNQTPMVKRRRFLGLFTDLVSSDFPLDPVARLANRPYLRRLAELGALWDSGGSTGRPAFAQVERDLYRLKGDSGVGNPQFGQVKQIFYSLASFHYCNFNHLRPVIRRWYLDLEPVLLRAGYENLRFFLQWLIDDMESGGAVWPEP